MARAGRKRKPGARHPCGQLKKIADAQQRLADAEKQVVLAQPHRRGNRGQLAGSALGRFCEANGIRRECFDAGEQWALDRSKWLGALNAPRLVTAERVHGSGNDVSFESVNRWRAKDMAGRDAMQRVAGRDGLAAVTRLAFDGFDLPPHAPIEPIVNALLALAVHYGLLPPSALPALMPTPKPRPALKAAPPEPEVADAKPWRPKTITPATPAAPAPPKERKKVNEAERLRKLRQTVQARRERRAAEAGAAMLVAAE